jgi:transcription-repair coupling factor (superfamily II helicase)
MLKIFEDFDNDLCISGLTTELKAKYIQENFINDNKSIFVVSSNQYEASKLYQSISNYNEKILFFPTDDFITSQAIAISPEFKNLRIRTMISLLNDNNYIVITDLLGYLKFVSSRNEFINKSIELELNKEESIKKIIDRLYDIGYSSETVVNKTGEFAIRGFVLDIFPVNYDTPVRIEFWGDTIVEIKKFNLDTQLSFESINNCLIRPNTDLFEPSETEDKIINYKENSIVIFNEYSQILSTYINLLDEVKTLNKENNKNASYFHLINDFHLKNVKYISGFDETKYGTRSIEYISQEISRFKNDFNSVKNELMKYISQNKVVVVCLSNRFKVNKVIEYFEEDAIFTDDEHLVDKKINIIIQNINEGYIVNNYVYISENEIFNRQTKPESYKNNIKIGNRIRDISKINVGDYVVHSSHGIGIYAGLTTISKNVVKKDYLQIDYKGSDKIYIPVEKIDLINKYSNADGSKPPINKLGSLEWQKTKEKARKRANDMAQELLKLYANREITPGFAFDKDSDEQILFEKEFPFEETPDQLKAVEEIKSDMEKSLPMDRLICGDVGFGKTEVAFRAMFKAVMSSKQVMMLCPTTILSRQHYINAIERFKSFPIRIELLNRFTSPLNQRNIIRDLLLGKVDIVIGTHRLLSSDIILKNLGLLVIDEEQRFGVKHKEKIKQIKYNIDVLTLSATPIPRTIQMALSGLKNLSLIETPPTNRHPIQTYVIAESDYIIKDAIYKEMARNGQVFILNNSIESMPNKVKYINSLVPEAKIAYAHGQMNKKELENIMVRFTNREYDVLISTTIIETGIDIPSANTLIIIDADRFGLSQLYQIRGRVGRSNKIAHCYLMYNKNHILSDIATKRLKAIKDFTELGSGFAIAMRDLSLRGAGDILGSEQAGFIDSVGIEMFSKMLIQQMAILKGEFLEEEVEGNPIVDVKTAIDDKYVSDEEIKIEIHKRINSISSLKELELVKHELEDRFGKADEDLIVYMYQELLEKYSNKLNIKNVNQNNRQIEIILSKEQTKIINGEKLFLTLIEKTKKITFSMKFNRLTITLNLNGLDKHFIYYLLDIFIALDNSLV